jgi:hypothetical protein
MVDSDSSTKGAKEEEEREERTTQSTYAGKRRASASPTPDLDDYGPDIAKSKRVQLEGASQSVYGIHPGYPRMSSDEELTVIPYSSGEPSKTPPPTVSDRPDTENPQPHEMHQMHLRLTQKRLANDILFGSMGVKDPYAEAADDPQAWSASGDTRVGFLHR